MRAQIKTMTKMVAVLGSIAMMLILSATAAAAPELDVKTQWGPTVFEQGEEALKRAS